MHKRRKNSSEFPTILFENSHPYIYCSSIFRDFKLTDTCVTGTSACVEGAVVGCVAERWVGPIGDPCSESEQCFAVPVDSLVRPHSVVSYHHILIHICRTNQESSWFAWPSKRLHPSSRLRVQQAEFSVVKIRSSLSFARFILLLSVALLLTIYCIHCVA